MESSNNERVRIGKCAYRLVNKPEYSRNDLYRFWNDCGEELLADDLVTDFISLASRLSREGMKDERIEENRQIHKESNS